MGKKRKWLSVLLAVAVTVTTPAFASLEVSADTAGTGTQLTDQDINNLTATTSKARTSVHDPSIVKDKDTGEYYVFGSHMGVSKSSDLMNWTSVTAQSKSSELFGIREEGSGGEEVVSVASYENAFLKSADQTDGKDYNIADWIYSVESTGKHTVEGNMWAPDVIYNESMQKYCMYLSLNGAHWNSAIVLLTADDIDGPYVYEAPIVFSGFSANDVKSYKDTDLEKVLGDLNTLPNRYNYISSSNWVSSDTWKSSSSWGDYLPHAIDPAVFYDEAGKLWMVYGSWSGGIFMLELDETTGLRDYDVTYDGNSTGKNITSDPYFGTKIAGGNYVSGEGPYIEYIDGFYYLFVSYGFYSPEGGYNMRVFRSETPDGQYVDDNGKSAIFDSYVLNYSATSSTNNRGLKLMGNYKWNTMSEAEVAQGHNSAFVDDDGKAYVVYHTKFADGTATHEVRVHELYVNEDGWPVAAPYEYDSSVEVDGTGYATEAIAGTYDVIVHDFQIAYADLAYKTPVALTLTADGKVSGAYEGTWIQDSTSNSATITLNNVTYKGVFAEQMIDGTKVKTMCFTIANSEGLCVWGSKIPGDSYSIAQSVKNTKVPTLALTDITLPTEGTDNVSISWSSDNTDVLSDDGTLVALPVADTTVNMTATYTKGDYYYQKSYPINVYAKAQNENESMLIASYFENEEVNLADKLDGSLYVDNPFSNTITPGVDISGGVTITFDVKADTPVNVLGTIFAFTGGGKLYFTPGSYLGYNATGGWFDANLKDYALVQDYIGSEATVSICLTADGFSVSVNGETVYDQSIRDTDNGAGTLTDYTDCLTWLNQTADKLYFGYGTWWTDINANCTISNFKCYANPIDLSQKPVDEITYTKEEVVLATNDAITYEDNPFYGKHIETFEMEYTINLKEGTPKLGWDGIFSFYDSETGTRVSVQTAPYICYNAGPDHWMDINQPALGGENAIVGCDFGENHTFILSLSSSGATMMVDGEPIAIEVNSFGATYANVIKAITKCDKLTWGVGKAETAFWNTEQCTLSNIRLQSGAEPKDVEEIVYDEITLTKDEVKLTANSSITREDNPFYGKNIENLNVEYTINLAADAAKNGWDGIFSFYNSQTGGRISFQTAPFVSYNSATGAWLDINNPLNEDNPDIPMPNDVIVNCEKGRDYTFAISITNSGATITLDGQPVEVIVKNSSSGVNYSNLLTYITKCDQLTWGVGLAETAYWNTEICTLKNVAIWSGERQYSIPEPVLVANVSLDASAATLIKGESKTLKVTVTPDNADNTAVEWTSSNDTVATVSNSGVITALKAGTTDIFATAKDGSNKSAACRVTVVDPTVSFNLKALTLFKNTSSAELKASGLQTGDSIKEYKSSNPDIVTVDNSGKLTAKTKTGSSTITVTTKYGATASCTVTVIDPTVSFNLKTLTLFTKASSTELKASGLKTGDSIKGYKSSKTDIVTVDNSGKLTAKAKTGSSIITVTTKYGATASCTVTVIKPTVSFNVKTLSLQIKKSTTALAASGLQKGDSIKSYKSSKTDVVTVNSKGKLTAKNKTGTAVITVTTKYGATATCKVTVQKAAVTTKSIKTDKSTYTIQKGKSVQIAVTPNPINSTDKITYTSSNKKIATVTSKGEVKGVKKGTCTITIKSGKVTKKVTIKVK